MLRLLIVLLIKKSHHPIVMMNRDLKIVKKEKIEKKMITESLNMEIISIKFQVRIICQKINQFKKANFLN